MGYSGTGINRWLPRYQLTEKQEVSSKRIVVEAKMALLSLNKDSGIVKRAK